MEWRSKMGWIVSLIVILIFVWLAEEITKKGGGKPQ